MEITPEVAEDHLLASGLRLVAGVVRGEDGSQRLRLDVAKPGDAARRPVPELPVNEMGPAGVDGEAELHAPDLEIGLQGVLSAAQIQRRRVRQLCRRHRRRCRALLRHQREGYVVYGAEGAAASRERCFGDYDWLHGGEYGRASLQSAVRSFARNWNHDLASRRIRINVLAPGATLTPGLHGPSLNEEAGRAFVATMEAQMPLGRMGRPDKTTAAEIFSLAMR